MRRNTILLLTAVAFSLNGCGWLTSMWPRGKKSVPVTEPTEEHELAFEPAETVASTTSDDPQAGDPSPARRPAPAPAENEDAASDPDDDPAPAGAAQNDPSPAAAEAEEPTYEETIVAASVLQVGNEFLTAEDLLRGAATQLASIDDSLPPDAFRREVAEILQAEIRAQVGLLLVLQEAEGQMTEQLEQAVDAQMQSIERDMIAQADGSRRKLMDRLKSMGTSLDYELERQRKQIVARNYISTKFNATIVIDRRTLWRYYREHIDDYSTDRRIQLQIIAAPYSAFPPEQSKSPARQARERIARAREQLKAGKEFGQVAKELSEGPRAVLEGVWPMVEAGGLREKKLEEVGFSLREGQISDVIETDSGLYLVKALKIEPGEVVSFLDAQEEIEQKLREEQVGRLTAKYYRQLYERELSGKSPRFFEPLVDRAMARHYER